MKNSHVLVVDDEKDFAAFTADALRDAGFKVTVAWDGDTAIRLLTEQKSDFDLVITDIMMAHLSQGFDLIRGIRQDKELGNLPVVILSGVRNVYDLDSQTQESWLKCDAFLDKPVSPNKLVETVIGALATRHDRPLIGPDDLTVEHREERIVNGQIFRDGGC